MRRVSSGISAAIKRCALHVIEPINSRSTRSGYHFHNLAEETNCWMTSFSPIYSTLEYYCYQRALKSKSSDTSNFNQPASVNFIENNIGSVKTAILNF